MFQSVLYARVGHTFGNTLLYGTFGLSASRIQYTGEYTGADPLLAGRKYDNEQSHLGWNAGLGLAYAITPSWSAGLEFRHVQFNDKPHPSTNNFGGVVSDRTISARDEQASVRLNYHFGR
jgi:opacity protein-like surface antigen